jgi:leader peptidase (prepilin peptidase)/N-methyltransferase
MHALTTHPRSPLTAEWLLVLTATVAALALMLRWGVAGAVVFAALLPAAWAASVDVRTGRLPNHLVVASVVPTGALLVHEVIGGFTTAAVVATVAAAALFAVPPFVIHLVEPAAMGFGDVKLAAVLGAAIGMVDYRAALLALCFASAGTAVVGLVLRRQTMPLGPGLVVGAAGALVVAAFVGATPLPWR